jgi:serine/threonine-protein kinase
MVQDHVLSFSSAATPEEVRRQLDKLLASHWFARSGRMCRFLRFGVERALAGAGNQIKEYLVGVEVYDRPADYDPSVDPIVRVEARRLRAKLDAYYATAGKNDAVLIKFPIGAYTPTFVARTEARHVRPMENRIAVLPFTNLSPESGNDYLSAGLTEELILLLTRIQGLQVTADYTLSQLETREPDAGAIWEGAKAETLLRGSCRHAGGRVRVIAQLIDTNSGTYLWSEAFERKAEDLVVIQEEIARAIVDKVASKLVVLSQAEAPWDGRYGTRRGDTEARGASQPQVIRYAPTG